MVATGLLAFGAGIAIGAAINNSCCGWGYSYWNCNWHGGAVYYGGGAYYGNNAWHGGYYGSSATAYGPNGVARAGNAYNPSTGTYARGASVATPYGKTAAGQAYNPNTGAYAATHQTSNAYGNYGSSVYSKNGNTAYTQHQTTAQGSVGTVQDFPTAAGVRPGRTRTVTLLRAKQQTATSMRLRTAPIQEHGKRLAEKHERKLEQCREA